MKNIYIEFDDSNYLWNAGHLHVYINGRIVESHFIDDYPDMDMDELFEHLKQKYNVKQKLRYKKINFIK